MTVALTDKQWTAEEFVVTDQTEFGDDWRYELVDGCIVGHAAPEPEHGAILAGLVGALGRLLAARPNGCRPESGSAATPKVAQRNTARIPDAMVRCGQHPRVLFEVVSPADIRDWRDRDRRRLDHQAVEGVTEIVELYQDDYAVHVYRRTAEGWVFQSVGARDGVLRLDSLDIDIPLAEIYVFADLAADA